MCIRDSTPPAWARAPSSASGSAPVSYTHLLAGVQEGRHVVDLVEHARDDVGHGVEAAHLAAHGHVDVQSAARKVGQGLG